MKGFIKVHSEDHTIQSLTEAKAQLIAEGYEPSYKDGKQVFSKDQEGAVTFDGRTATYYMSQAQA